jgi:hypothetical protein
LPHPYTHPPHANQAKRIWFKLHTKYGGDVSKVTDCARISLEFTTAEGLERAAKLVLQSASTFKNRVANPTDEGYRDLMFTVLIEGHVCEVTERLATPLRPFAICRLQRTTAICMGWGAVAGVRRGAGGWRLGRAGVGGGRGRCGLPPRRSHAVPRAPPPQVQLHLVEMVKAKKSGAGHRMYKVCRRVLTGPIVKKDTYCLVVVGTELRGWGGRNALGEEEGRGMMVYASGDMYEGQWRAGKKHGQGKYTTATGDVYEGEYVENVREGHGKLSFATGDVYEGGFVDGKKHGVGTYTTAYGRVSAGYFDAGAMEGQGVRWSFDRTEAWELQEGKKVRSIPLLDAKKIAERIGLPPPPSRIVSAVSFVS